MVAVELRQALTLVTTRAALTLPSKPNDRPLSATAEKTP